MPTATAAITTTAVTAAAATTRRGHAILAQGHLLEMAGRNVGFQKFGRTNIFRSLISVGLHRADTEPALCLRVVIGPTYAIPAP